MKQMDPPPPLAERLLFVLQCPFVCHHGLRWPSPPCVLVNCRRLAFNPPGFQDDKCLLGNAGLEGVWGGRLM